MPQKQGQLEWLQTNQTGSFAMSCVDRIPRRKYHSLLTIREPGFGEPLHAISEVAETFQTQPDAQGVRETFFLHSFNFEAQIHPHGFTHLEKFSYVPRPVWRYRVGEVQIERTLELDPNQDITRITYAFSGITKPSTLTLEPLITCRPWHRTTKHNPFLDGCVQYENDGVSLQPYSPLPRLYFKVSGKPSVFNMGGRWLKNVFYSIENERGYPATDDLFGPGSFQVQIDTDCEITLHCGAQELSTSLPTKEKKLRPSFSEPALKRAASQFLITKKSGHHSVIAGYPWFEDWDRDTLLSLPGLCLATGRFKHAKSVLSELGARYQKQLIPNAPTISGIPQNLMIDAPLLFIRAVQLLGEATDIKQIHSLMPAVISILNSFKNGMDPRIEVRPGAGFFVTAGPYAATWMDVVWNGKPLTPRHGFAVDLNALFYNAVHFAMDWAQHNHTDPTAAPFIKNWSPILDGAKHAFMKRFWSEDHGYLADTNSSDEEQDADLSLRPNQLWAIALKYSAVPAKEAGRMLEKIRSELLTPVGLRTLSSHDIRYRGHYSGDPEHRDHAYHQGTVWPWLIGIYADAVTNIQGPEKMRKDLTPVLERLGLHFAEEGCLGQISEVFDGDTPHTPNGTPAQAWSVAEVLRAYKMMKKD
ncbi:amylo-alpha-1,6-glucosidase [Bdellovibrionota bacterium FG-2]